jgi:NAD(P)-dependent dehydrogenase (short-subunit alcohol dehydrogenase family)
MKLFELAGDVAFVTGAGTGIGRAIAIGLAEAGADVACFGRSRKRAPLEETAAAITALGRGAIVTEGTVTEKADLHAAIARAWAELGGPCASTSSARAIPSPP